MVQEGRGESTVQGAGEYTGGYSIVDTVWFRKEEDRVLYKELENILEGTA